MSHTTPAAYGGYEIGRSYSAKGTDGKSQAAFRSGSQRFDDNGTGDPGAYDPHLPTDIGSSSTKSFNIKQQPFGGVQPRFVDIDPEHRPGPGKYDVTYPSDQRTDSRSGFASTVVQRPFAKEDHPHVSPASYSSESYSSSKFSTPKNTGGAQLRSKSGRFDPNYRPSTDSAVRREISPPQFKFPPSSQEPAPASDLG